MIPNSQFAKNVLNFQLITWWMLATVVLLGMPFGCTETKNSLGGTSNLVPLNPCAGPIKKHIAVTPVTRPFDNWMDRHNVILERNMKRNADLIFIGNSLTQRWESNGKEVWEKYYSNRNALNMGFDGDGTQHVLWRIDHGEIDGLSPKVVVLLIGSNHVNGYKIEEISDGIKAIVCRIRTKLPETKILVLGILPRGDATAAAAYRLNKASEEASRMADNKYIFYLNCSEKFLDKDGNISKTLMVEDGVHLTVEGYRLLAGQLEPLISKWMGNPISKY